jgi:hypothetical protein
MTCERNEVKQRNGKSNARTKKVFQDRVSASPFMTNSPCFTSSLRSAREKECANHNEPAVLTSILSRLYNCRKTYEGCPDSQYTSRLSWDCAECDIGTAKLVPVQAKRSGGNGLHNRRVYQDAGFVSYFAASRCSVASSPLEAEGDS